jgi:tetratricopeptide (TPR) repeat protein
MGQIQYRQGDRAGARASFERATALDRKALPALAGLLQIDASAKQFDRALQRVDKELKESPKDAGLLLIAARTYTAANNLSRAEELARQAIDANPSSFDGYNLLGQLYVRQKKLNEALQEYGTIAKQQPSNVAARTMVGMLLQVQNRQDDAKREFEEILAIDPRAAVAANNLAYLHAESGTNLDAALNLAQTAKAGLPEDPNVSDTLGWVYYKRNLSATAIDAFQQSVKKDPANPVYHYHLGLALLQSKDEAGARAALERALQLKLQPKEAADARKALASIRG